MSFTGFLLIVCLLLNSTGTPSVSPTATPKSTDLILSE